MELLLRFVVWLIEALFPMRNPPAVLALAVFAFTRSWWALAGVVASLVFVGLLRVLCEVIGQCANIKSAVDNFQARFDRFQFEELKFAELLTKEQLASIDWKRPPVVRVADGVEAPLEPRGVRVFLVRTLSGPLVAQLKSFISGAGACYVFLRDRPRAERPSSMFKLLHELGHLSGPAVARWNARRAAVPLALLGAAAALWLARGDAIAIAGLAFFLSERVFFAAHETEAELEVLADAYGLDAARDGNELAAIVKPLLEVWEHEQRTAKTVKKRAILGARRQALARNAMLMAQGGARTAPSAPEGRFSKRNLGYGALFIYCAWHAHAVLFTPWVCAALGVASLLVWPAINIAYKCLARQDLRAELLFQIQSMFGPDKVQGEGRKNLAELLKNQFPSR